MTLIEFLAARLDEDEAAARSATPGPWKSSQPPWPDQSAGPVITSARNDDWALTVDAHDAAHIARHDPARVLTEVKAKRALVAATVDQDPFDALGAESGYEWLILQHLALSYADHPDYDESWRP